MIRSFHSLLALASLSLWPLTASAHSLWIEPLPDGNACVRFAQWGDEYEVSPGHLDSFVDVSGWVLDAEGKPTLFDVAKKHDHFLLGKGAANQPIFAQAQFTVRKLHDDKPARAPIFYCRWQPEGAGAGTPALTMDIVPTGKPGEARVYFRGKPLADVEVVYFAPSKDEQKLRSDAEGLVQAPDPTKLGNHLFAVARYSEGLAGFFKGVPFAITSHSASLYWTVKAK